jgi:hypothetical protein
MSILFPWEPPTAPPSTAHNADLWGRFHLGPVSQLGRVDVHGRISLEEISRTPSLLRWMEASCPRLFLSWGDVPDWISSDVISLTVSLLGCKNVSDCIWLNLTWCNVPDCTSPQVMSLTVPHLRYYPWPYLTCGDIHYCIISEVVISYLLLSSKDPPWLQIWR